MKVFISADMEGIPASPGRHDRESRPGLRPGPRADDRRRQRGHRGGPWLPGRPRSWSRTPMGRSPWGQQPAHREAPRPGPGSSPAGTPELRMVGGLDDTCDALLLIGYTPGRAPWAPSRTHAGSLRKRLVQRRCGGESGISAGGCGTLRRALVFVSVTRRWRRRWPQVISPDVTAAVVKYALRRECVPAQAGRDAPTDPRRRGGGPGEGGKHRAVPAGQPDRAAGAAQHSGPGRVLRPGAGASSCSMR